MRIRNLAVERGIEADYPDSVLDTRQRKVLRILWSEGGQSRSELHRRTGLTSNGVGALAETMLRGGLLRECPVRVARSAAGRPRVPLEIDPTRRHIVGLALMQGRTEVARVGLTGALSGEVVASESADPSRLIPMAAEMLRSTCNAATLGVGLSVTGLFDPPKRTLLFSSVMQGGPVADLSPIIHAAGDLHVILDNDMHALAARWLLTHRADHEEDILIVRLDDGHAGAALLVDGRPNRGCAAGGNELGHTRFFVETERCFCGHTGCLERIVSTPFLHMRDRRAGVSDAPTLGQRIEQFTSMEADSPLAEMSRYLACALANAVNFIRPHRLVLASPFIRDSAYGDSLVALSRSMILPQLSDVVKIDRWWEPTIGADTAAWLALAELLYGGWNQSGLCTATPVR